MFLLNRHPTVTAADPAVDLRLRHLAGADQTRSWNRRELLHEIFESRVDANPTGIAVECDTRRISYLDLDRRANQISHLLRYQSVGAGSTVALLLPRSELVYFALLGILKSGAAYVPIDPDYPAERVAHILADAKPAAIITSTDLASKCAGYATFILRLDTDSTLLDRQPIHRLTRQPVFDGTLDGT